jgi:hypothetical protein
LVGLSPTEHTSFILDTLPYGGFSPVRLQGRPIRRCLPSEAPNCRAHLVCIPLSRSSLPNLFPPLGVGAVVRLSAAIRATMVALPQGSSLRSGLFCPGPSTLN